MISLTCKVTGFSIEDIRQQIVKKFGIETPKKEIETLPVISVSRIGLTKFLATAVRKDGISKDSTLAEILNYTKDKFPIL